MLPLLEGTPILACVMHAWERRRVRVFRLSRKSCALSLFVDLLACCAVVRRLRDSVRRVCLCVPACACVCAMAARVLWVGRRSQILFVIGLGLVWKVQFGAERAAPVP